MHEMSKENWNESYRLRHYAVPCVNFKKALSTNTLALLMRLFLRFQFPKTKSTRVTVVNVVKTTNYQIKKIKIHDSQFLFKKCRFYFCQYLLVCFVLDTNNIFMVNHEYHYSIAIWYQLVYVRITRTTAWRALLFFQTNIS